MRILVTGGAGFIGSHLVEELLRHGHKVRVIDNCSTGRPENLKDVEQEDNFEGLFFGSVLDLRFGNLKKCFKWADCVYHLACLGVRESLINPIKVHRVNAEGALHVLKECTDNSVGKFVYVSSSEVYGNDVWDTQNEATRCRPATVYGASKLAGEHYAIANMALHRMKTLILRPFNVYGPRSHYEGASGELIPRTIALALRGDSPTIFGHGDNVRDFTYVLDMVRALRMALDRFEHLGWASDSQYQHETLCISSGLCYSVSQVTDMLSSITGIQTIRRLPARSGDVGNLHCLSKPFREHTGWHPEVTMPEGLLKTYNYFKDLYTKGELNIDDVPDCNWSKATEWNEEAVKRHERANNISGPTG